MTLAAAFICILGWVCAPCAALGLVAYIAYQRGFYNGRQEVLDLKHRLDAEHAELKRIRWNLDKEVTRARFN